MNNKAKYNPHIHNRRSIRLKGYDYSQAGLYFITICCKDREHLFGKIENDEMVLNDAGKIAFNEWMKTPLLRNNVALGEFVIMPNHMHGIIRLFGRGELHPPNNNDEMIIDLKELHPPNNNDEMIIYETKNRGVFNTPLRSPTQNIGAIVRGYKSSVTKQIKQLGELYSPDQIWQRNYYEHIIRNEKSYQNISKYIINNPAKWIDDKFY